MSKGRIQSSPLAANEAVAELTHVQTNSYQNAEVELGQSNLASMKAGTTVTNQMASVLEALTSALLTQANKFPQVAHAPEEQDTQLARTFRK